jgi:glycosyltransferase involved in cell wall biosynthesis
VTEPQTLLIVPTLGQRRRYLYETLQSLAWQGSQPRVIVVSPSRAPIGDICEHFLVERLILDEPGLSKAVNRGWTSSTRKEKYWAWLGDDDLLAPNSIAMMQQVLDEGTGADFAYGRSRYIDADTRSIYLSRPPSWTLASLAYGKDHVPQPGSLFRRSAVDALGGLDESLRNAMDLDLFLRLGGRKSGIRSISEVSAYRLHDTNITVLKGSEDESAPVRRRYQDIQSAPVGRCVELGMRAIDRAMVFAQWRLSRGSIPTGIGTSDYLADLRDAVISADLPLD